MKKSFFDNLLPLLSLPLLIVEKQSSATLKISTGENGISSVLRNHPKKATSNPNVNLIDFK